jgi:8-oxo-dGTP pyrophosphatase MutT (NUDIX family)
MASPEYSAHRLSGSDAVAAILCLPDSRYVVQRRDRKPGIWFPGHWGFFGGAVDEGESPLAALHRELEEEIELRAHGAVLFTQFHFDMTALGLRRYYRNYYVIHIDAEQLAELRLHEGEELGLFTGEDLLQRMRMAPYDAFALELYHRRQSIGTGWLREAPSADAGST